jgi:hypothetical protein
MGECQKPPRAITYFLRQALQQASAATRPNEAVVA